MVASRRRLRAKAGGGKSELRRAGRPEKIGGFGGATPRRRKVPQKKNRRWPAVAASAAMAGTGKGEKVPLLREGLPASTGKGKSAPGRE